MTAEGFDSAGMPRLGTRLGPQLLHALDEFALGLAGHPLLERALLLGLQRLRLGRRERLRGAVAGRAVSRQLGVQGIQPSSRFGTFVDGRNWGTKGARPVRRILECAVEPQAQRLGQAQHQQTACGGRLPADGWRRYRPRGERTWCARSGALG